MSKLPVDARRSEMKRFKRNENISLFSKIIPPRKKEPSCQVIPTVPRTAISKPLICYPFTGASYSKPMVPSDDVPFPTQVSEQEGSNTNEFVFSNGKSANVENAAYNQIPSVLHATNVGTNFVSYSSHPDQQQKFQRNDVHNRKGGQHESKRPAKPPRYPEYTDYGERLRSFARGWKQYPDPTTLSNAGFFYTDKEDLVRCYQCGIGLKDFSNGDNPMNERVKHPGDCPYLKEYLGQEGLANIKIQVQPQDLQHNREELSSTFAAKYRHPEYQSYQVRLSSFSQWPQSLMQRPEQLAEAGLYYTGFEDNVRCFACDGGLRKWDPEDDPWIEHCRWFPDCSFVRKQKGDQYIRLVQATTAMEIKERLGTEDKATNINSELDITGEIERITLNDPELNAVIDEHRETCLEMGYSEKDFNKAATKLAKKGNVRPTIEDILDVVESTEQIDSEGDLHKNETQIEENVRLKSTLFCMTCGINAVNALFLPCTHHRMCMDCAKQLSECPVCDRHIRQKIKNYLV